MNAKRIRMGGLLVGLPLVLAACTDRAGDLVSPEGATPDRATTEANGRVYGMYASGYSATAYASLLNGGVQVVLPRLAAAGVDGCSPTAASYGTLASATLPLLGSVGALTTTTDSFPTPDGWGIRATNTTAQVSLLGGLITADEIVSIAVARPRYGALTAGSTRSRFTNLRVLGVAIVDEPEPNTRIDLPGIGYVVLYERALRITPIEAAAAVTMMRVVVDVDNALGLAVGTQLLLGHTQASMSERGTPVRLTGAGYAARVTGVANLPILGAQGLPCDGTDGQVLQSSSATLSLPGLVSVQGLTSRARGVVGVDSVNGFTQAEVAEVSLLNGLVSAEGVYSTARVDRDGSVVRRTGSSQIAKLVIAGDTINVSALQPNTQIPLAGIGTIWINRIVETATSIEVRALEIVVQVPNELLDVGVTVRAGVASASAMS